MMKVLDKINITEFLKGPALILHNIFRISRMPVEASEQDLINRHKALEMPEKVKMPTPPGPLPIFPLKNENTGKLKSILHHHQEPLNHLFNELFWFWPNTFGENEKDEGLTLLKEGRIKNAIQYWKRGERETENH